MKLNDEASGNWLFKAIGCAGAIIICFYLVGSWFGRALGPLKEAGRSKQCQDNLRVLVRAEQMYAMDYEDRLPPAANWMDRIDAYWDKKGGTGADRLRCPEVAPQGGYGYAMNGDLGGRVRAKIDGLDAAPLIFDSPDMSKSAVSKGLVLPSSGRHIGQTKKGQTLTRGNLIGLGGGGVRFMSDR